MVQPGAVKCGARRTCVRSARLWVLALCCVVCTSPSLAISSEGADIEIFTRSGCPRCAAGERFLETLRQQRPALRIIVRDVGADASAAQALRELAARNGVRALGVPAFYVRGQLVVGFRRAETTGRALIALLDASPEATSEPAPSCSMDAADAERCREPAVIPSLAVESISVPLIGTLSVGQVGLPAFTLVIGLLDGFNPCAMWVLLFILSLLVNLHDRLKMFVIGGTFVVVSGAAYFAFMAAWLNIFLLLGVARATQTVLGAVAVVVGAMNVKEFVAFGAGVTLSIPDSAKPTIYARVRRIVQAENLVAALAGVVVLAVLVNIVELLCTAGFPAVYTRILTLRQLPSWQYYAYLFLYNVAYMLDDSIMLAVAVVTLGRHKLQERGGRWLKLVSGAVMLALGIALIVAPDWLSTR